MREWFLERQIRIALAVSVVSILMLVVAGHPGWPAGAAIALVALIPISVGGRLFDSDTTENWLRFSYTGTARSIVGGVLMLLGWAILLRGVVATSIAAVLLKMN